MKQFDVILLLGNRLYDDGTPDLNTLARVRKAAELWKCGAAPIIVSSGGKGFSENHDRTQADVMAEFLMEFGIPNDVIIREDTSRTTWQNLINTKKILGKDTFTAAVATSDIHMRRSLLMCKKLGIKAKGFPAKLPHDRNWRARRRLEWHFTIETYVGWFGKGRPTWVNPIRERLIKRDKRVSNEAFEAYNAVLRERSQEG